MLHIRFRDARKAKGLTQKELAKMANSTQSAIYKIENGLTLNPRNLSAFAESLGVTEQWLRFGSVTGTINYENGLIDRTTSTISSASAVTVDSDLNLDSSPLGEQRKAIFVNIPVYDIYFSAGDGCYFDTAEVLEHQALSIAMLEKYQVSQHDVFIARIKGESMEQTLLDKDTVLINKSVIKPQDNKIFAFAFDDELKVKRFFKQLNGSWRISSDNEDKNRYRDEIVSHHNIESLGIIGQVLTILDRPLI